MKTQLLLFYLLGVIALTKNIYADETNFGKKKPTINQVNEVFSRALSSPDNAVNEDNIKQNIKSRSIDMSNLYGNPNANKKKRKQTIYDVIPKEVAISQEINFGYNSAELTDLAKDYLKPVGESMASKKFQSLDFIVEGHTDAIGGSAYNINLSEKRAASVKRFLVDTFHIEPFRIRITGKGKSELLDPKNPESEVNRRVKIIAKK